MKFTFTKSIAKLVTGALVVIGVITGIFLTANAVTDTEEMRLVVSALLYFIALVLFGFLLDVYANWNGEQEEEAL